jgi:hypothetical protein
MIPASFLGLITNYFTFDSDGQGTVLEVGILIFYAVTFPKYRAVLLSIRASNVLCN